MQLVARSLFRFRISVAFVAFALVWAGGATSVAAADPGGSDWLASVNPSEVLDWTDGLVEVSPSAEVPEAYVDLLPKIASGLNAGIAAGIYAVDDQFNVTWTKGGRAKARAEIESLLGGCVKASNVTVSWIGLQADLEDACNDGQTPSDNTDAGVMTTQSGLQGCLVNTIGWMLGLMFLLFLPGGILFWAAVGVAAWQMVGVVVDCWDVWAAQAQKVNGWHSCAMTSRNTTQMSFDCGPWPWG